MRELSPELREKYVAAVVDRHMQKIVPICMGGVIFATFIANSMMPESALGSFSAFAASAIVSGVAASKSKAEKRDEAEIMADDELAHEFEEIRRAQNRSRFLWALGLAVLAIALVLTPSGNAFLNALFGAFFDGVSK